MSAAQEAAKHAKTPAQKRLAAKMLELEAKGDRLGFYTSGWRGPSRPVVLIREGDFVHVRGLTGRWKGRAFSIVRSEFSMYIPLASKFSAS